MTTTKLPDGPQQPRLLQLIQWIADPLSCLDAYSRRYGDMFTLQLTSSAPFVFLSHPQAIQEIFTADPKQFDSGRTSNIIKPIVGEHSLMLLDGNTHASQRRLMMPPFHGERMQSYSQIISESTKLVASQWEIGKSFEMRTACQEITLEVILHAVFGLREGERYQQIKPLLAGILNMTDSPLSSSLLFFNFLQKDWEWSPWGKMIRQRKQVYDLLRAEISGRQKSEITGNDVLSLMMSARDENGQPMTEPELMDQLMTLLVAGHETTATALAWAFYWIYKLPNVQEKLLTELASLGDNPQPFAVSKLPYLSAVCSETLRIYPIVPVTFLRTTNSPIKIMGHEFAENTIFAPSIYLTHHREELYPEPNQFKPERFLERQFSPYEYLPFGGGNRRCIGFALALLEMKLVLATVLSNYQLTLDDRQTVKPQRRGLTIVPSGGVRLVLEAKRQHSHSKNQPIVKTV
ncbi:MAG: cytochrome P450 [Coleofasciculaceae cyanobacterium]